MHAGQVALDIGKVVDVGRRVLTRSMGIVLSIFCWSVRSLYMDMP